MCKAATVNSIYDTVAETLHDYQVLGDVVLLVAATGSLVPDSLVMPLQYNLSLALTWSHFLSVRGKAAPTTFEAASVATLRALRSASCLVLLSQGLEYSQVRHPLYD